MDSEKYEDQIGHIYRAIGRFIVEVSQLVHTLEAHASWTLGPPPAGSGKSAPAQKAVARYFEAINRAGRGLVRDDDRKSLSQLHKELAQLIDERDRIAHDVWFVGWGSSDTTDWTPAERWQYRSGKEWAPINKPTLTAEGIDALAQDADRLRRLVGNVWGVVMEWPNDPERGPARVLKIVGGRLTMNR